MPEYWVRAINYGVNWTNSIERKTKNKEQNLFFDEKKNFINY